MFRALPACGWIELMPLDSRSVSALLYGTARAAKGFAARHRRGLSGTFLIGLAGFGVTAFGIAPLAPDAADLPRRQITEAIAPEGLAGQLTALADLPLLLNRSEQTRASDTADTLLRRLGLVDADAAQFLRHRRR